jgi:putative pyoverdin transport system ATP-binding/permease protein
MKNGNGSRAHIVSLLLREAPEKKKTLISMAVLSGISNALVLAVINAGAATATTAGLNLQLFLLFVLTLALFILTKNYIMQNSIVMVEDIIRRIRVRLSNKVRHSELPRLETIGRATIFTRVTTEATTISQSAPFIIDGCQSAIMVAFCIVYIGVLSRPAVYVTLGLIVTGIVYYLGEKKAIRARLLESNRKEIGFVGAITNVLDGFKEIRMNRAKSDDVFRNLETIAEEARELKIGTGLKFVQSFIFSQVFFYVLLGVNVFILPRFIDTHSAEVVKITSAILFIVGPLSGLVSSLQLFATATVAIENIYRLEHELGDVETEPPPSAAPNGFREIAFERVAFAYADRGTGERFSVGPLGFSVRRGETVFIVGGNGSGKSTLLKLLTGLYRPDSGAIRLDGEALVAETLAGYREHFAVIFSDYHLFDRLYGIPGVDPERVKELLRAMDLDRKTDFVDGGFTNLDLSSGQKKRLALVAAILEDKPIYVFDEWAADQDPQFRRHFYEEILRDLKARGKTVIAVTHDDKYFHTADRVLKMDYGSMSELPPGGKRA